MTENEPNIKSVVLNGQNVMESALYRSLFEEDSLHLSLKLDDAYARVAFYGQELPSQVTYLDKYGNYKFRPGLLGSRLPIFVAFLEHIKSLGALKDETSCPLYRSTSVNEQE